MKLLAAKKDAQLLANRLKGSWLIVHTDIAKEYRIVPEGEAEPGAKVKVTVTPNYNTHEPVKIRIRNYKAMRKRQIKKYESLRETTIYVNGGGPERGGQI